MEDDKVVHGSDVGFQQSLDRPTKSVPSRKVDGGFIKLLRRTLFVPRRKPR